MIGPPRPCGVCLQGWLFTEAEVAELTAQAVSQHVQTSTLVVWSGLNDQVGDVLVTSIVYKCKCQKCGCAVEMTLDEDDYVGYSVLYDKDGQFKTETIQRRVLR